MASRRRRVAWAIGAREALDEALEGLAREEPACAELVKLRFFAGPALGGILLVTTSVEMVFFVSALSCAWSALMLIGVGRMTAPTRQTSSIVAAS